MLDINKISSEIKALEHQCNTSYDVCKKLAMLYIIKDHYPQYPMKEESTEYNMMSMPATSNKII